MAIKSQDDFGDVIEHASYRQEVCRCLRIDVGASEVLLGGRWQMPGGHTAAVEDWGRAWGTPRTIIVPILRPSATVRALRIISSVRVDGAQVRLADGRRRLARDLRRVGRADGAQVELPIPEWVVLERAPRDRTTRESIACLAANRAPVAEPCMQQSA